MSNIWQQHILELFKVVADYFDPGFSPGFRLEMLKMGISIILHQCLSPDYFNLFRPARRINTGKAVKFKHIGGAITVSWLPVKKSCSREYAMSSWCRCPRQVLLNDSFECSRQLTGDDRQLCVFGCAHCICYPVLSCPLCSVSVCLPVCAGLAWLTYFLDHSLVALTCSASSPASHHHLITACSI